MPIGIVSDDIFNEEIEKPNSHERVIPVAEIIDIKRGRGSVNEVPDSLRKIIGETALTESRPSALDLANQFGISSSSVSAYTKGATSTDSYHKPTTDLGNHIAKVKENIAKKARNRLQIALNEITPERLAAAKIRDVSAIAKDMSGIVRDMESDSSNSSDLKERVPFVVYAPQFFKEDHFETIIVNE